MPVPPPLESLSPQPTPRLEPVTAAPAPAMAALPAPSLTRQQSQQQQAARAARLASPRNAVPSRKRPLVAPYPPVERAPYLFDLGLYDEPGGGGGMQGPVDGHDTSSLALDLDLGLEPLLDLPPIEHSVFQTQMHAPVGELECARCWESGARCAECTQRKQAQFDSQGWPLESAQFGAEPTYVKQEMPGQEDWSDVKTEPVEHEYEHKTELPPLSDPLFAAVPSPPHQPHAMEPARVQGRLTRFLPEGVDMIPVGDVDPYYTTAFEARQAEQDEEDDISSSGRPVRRRVMRARSPSPDLSSERSATPEAFDSAYETDPYEAEDEPRPVYRRQSTSSRQRLPRRVSPPAPMPKDGELALPESISPSAAGFGDHSSDNSSAEPPQPTHLLPVSARDLLPSRPSTAAIPPAHIKDRLVKSAKKLLTAADGADESVQVQVIPLYYPHKGAPNAHKIRIIRVENTRERTVSVYAHAADAGGVVERKSNISRLFGKFDSPSEKLLMNVVGAHNHQVGQESNILTLRGVLKFLEINKMKGEHAYRAWIQRELLPRLRYDPLEVGDEEVEIEASTNPNAPTRVRPRKLKRKDEKNKAKRRKSESPASKGADDTDSVASTSTPPPKRQKLPSSSPPSLSTTPHFSGFSGTSSSGSGDNPPPFALNSEHPMSHAA